MSSVETAPFDAVTTDRKLPPVSELAIVTIALVVVGGVYMASHLPKHFSLAFPVADTVVAGAVLVTNVVLLSRIRPFAWGTFFLVAKWALAAYAVISGMLVYAFARDHTPAGPMAVLAVMLAIFAVDIPMLFAFTVARYQQP
jgi:hypothetical protein